LEYKVSKEYIFYEVLALYIPQPHHLLYTFYVVLDDLLVKSFVDLSEYLREKRQPLLKVKSIPIKGVLIIVFS
jgi:hypothetical protein